MDRDPSVTRLAAGQLRKTRQSYVTRRVDLDRASFILAGEEKPQAGDLVLAQVIRLGHHQKLELVDGRRAHLREGQDVILAYGNRYAPDQYEGLVPGDLLDCHLVAGGGIAARVNSAHDRVRRPTRIRPKGLLIDSAGRRLNLRDFAIAPAMAGPRPDVPVIGVCGTSMNAGKTYVAAQITAGLAAAGFRVGAAKVTGTGSGGDRWQVEDAGSCCFLDFTDAGHASTYGLNPEQVLGLTATLTARLSDCCDVIVIELADGLLQKETRALLAAPAFARLCDALVHCAADSVGVVAGAQWLTALDLPLVAVSGVVGRSPLGMREAVGALRVPVVAAEDFYSGGLARQFADMTAAAKNGAAEDSNTAESGTPQLDSETRIA